MKSAAKKLNPGSVRLNTDERYTRLFSTKNGNALSLRSGYVVLKESENIGEHNTDDAEEMLIILEGKGELLINKSEILDFEKSTALYIPPNTVHDVKNIGKGLLKYIFVTCPAVQQRQKIE